MASAYLVTKPEPLISIFLKRGVEKNDGSLHTSLVTDLNSDTQNRESEYSSRSITYING